MTTLYEQHHMTVERDGDTFIIRQIDHSGNDEGIALHVSQIRQLAEAAGVLKKPMASPVRNATLAGSHLMQQLEIDIDDDDGTIRLFQTRLQGMGGSDEEIELHPMQATWLVTMLNQHLGTHVPREAATLKRRLRLLAERIGDLACNDARIDVVARSPFGVGFFDEFDALHTLACDFVADMDDGNEVEGAATRPVVGTVEIRAPMSVPEQHTGKQKDQCDFFNSGTTTEASHE